MHDAVASGRIALPLGLHIIVAQNECHLVNAEMRGVATARVVACGIFLFLLADPRSRAQQKPQWKWTDGAGKSHTRSELDEILWKHNEWHRSGRTFGAPADLHGANLRGAHLEDADLDGAHLEDADLNGAHLDHADLNGAHLERAHLEHAYLEGAVLGGAYLDGADLSFAQLDLAYLPGADLNGASFAGADLDHTMFEPQSLPVLVGIAAATHLELLTYDYNTDALVQLRKKFQDSGFHEQERKITYALKRTETEIAWQRCASRPAADERARAILWSPDSNLANCGAVVLNRMFFDWTCQYGMSPGRPLSLGVLLWLLCSALYFACIRTSGKSGLYRVYSPNVDEDPSAPPRVEKIFSPVNQQARGARRVLQFLRREWAVLRTAMFFSLMSAFNIGFRDINFGRWLRLLTRQEFDIKAVGWARVVAGWQSLISVFLIALWVLTEFGRPFG